MQTTAHRPKASQAVSTRSSAWALSDSLIISAPANFARIWRRVGLGEQVSRPDIIEAVLYPRSGHETATTLPLNLSEQYAGALSATDIKQLPLAGSYGRQVADEFSGWTLVCMNEYYALTESAVMSKVPTSVAATVKWERVFSDLGSLVDGDDFVAPTADLLSDLEDLAEILPTHIQFPEIEHDSSNGLISLSWFAAQAGATFSMTLRGARRLFSVYINPVTGLKLPFRDQIIDGRAIVDMFDDPRILEVVGGESLA